MLNSGKYTVFTNKAIRRVKVAVTTKCNSDCGYCFIHCPTSDMTWPVAQAAVDLLLGSPKDKKLLSCYGGEPILQFQLLKQIVIYARDIEKKNNKRLLIECCTNSLLLTDDHLRFFREFDVRVHISLFGHEQDNTRYRTRGFEKVIENLAKASEVLGPTHTGACVCVSPKTAHYLREDIETIKKKTGTRVIMIEPIIEFEQWSMADVAVFIQQVRLVCKDLIDSLTTPTPFFLNSLCEHLNAGARYPKVSSSAGYDRCPFFRSLDVGPSGDMAFSPFALYGKEVKRGVVGNVQKVQGSWWQNCVFKIDSPGCLNCYSKYYLLGTYPDKSKYLMSYMGAVIDETVRFLKAAGISDPRYGQYIKEAAELYVGYKGHIDKQIKCQGDRNH